MLFWMTGKLGRAWVVHGIGAWVVHGCVVSGVGRRWCYTTWCGNPGIYLKLPFF